MAVVRLKVPIDPNVPRKKRKRFSDTLSVQPSAKMIGETTIRRGSSKTQYLTVTLPTDNTELKDALFFAVPTMAKIKIIDFLLQDSPEGTPPIKLDEYRCSHSTENITALYKFGKTHRFVFDGDIAVRALASTDEARELERMSYAKSTSLVECVPLNGTPYPFQVAGMSYMLKTKKCINADQMGLGKTIQAIMATATAKAYPALFIVPNQLKMAPWKKEWNTWAPKRKATTIVADNSNIKSIHRTFRVRNAKIKKWETRRNDVIIVNYDRLAKYKKYLKKVKWRAIVLDESHYIKNPNADRTREVIELIDTCQPEYVWLLSGTPIKAKPEHLVTQLRVIGRLEDFGGRANFMKRYCLKTSTDEEYYQDDVTVQELAKRKHETSIELNTHLRSLCYLRRNKAEVLHDLPAKTRSVLTFKLNAHYRAEYTQVETDLVSYLMERAMQDEAFLKSVKKLPKKEREFAIAEYRSEVEYKSARAEILQKIELCKQVAALGKLEQMKEWIDSFLESDEKLVLFCNHKMVINELAEAFPKIHMKIVGGQDALASDKDKAKFDLDDRATIRDAAVARFQKDPKCTLGLCSIGAGGVGHTLTAANNVGLFELPWGPADCDQAEDRCHRIGQKDNVTCWYFVAEDTIEERILELIESKRMVLNAVHDGNPLHGMNDGSVMIDLIKILTRGKIVLL